MIDTLRQAYTSRWKDERHPDTERRTDWADRPTVIQIDTQRDRQIGQTDRQLYRLTQRDRQIGQTERQLHRLTQRERQTDWADRPTVIQTDTERDRQTDWADRPTVV